MNKALKIFLLVFLAILACVAAGVWYASSFVNPAQLTRLLSSSVKEATGRELVISGPVSLSVFPTISVKAEQVSLTNAAWASNPDMLTLKHMELDIRLMPLLKGSIEIGRIGLQGLQLNLQTNQAGEGNWNLAPPVNNSGKLDASASSNAADGSANFISYNAIDVEDAQIQFQQSDKNIKVFKLPKLTVDAGEDLSNILMDLRYENYALGLKGKTSLLRNVFRDWDQSPVKVNVDVDLTLNGKLLAITGVIDKQPSKLPHFQINLNSKSFDLAPLAGSAVVAGSAGKSGTVAPHKSQGKYFFSDEALPFNLLPIADGSVSINIAELGLPNQTSFTNFKTTLQFKNDRIDSNDLSFNLGKGSAHAQLSISDLNRPIPKVALRGMAKDFTLEQILATTDSKASVSGGDMQVAWNLKGSGVSPHQLVSQSTGVLQFSMRNAKLDSQFLNKGGDFVITVFDAINPLYKKSNQTVLECAVGYLPINSGVVNIQNSVGVETDRLDVVLSGSINLGTEALNLSINPREKSGLTTGLDLAGLVKIEGTLQNPSTGVNKAGVVNSAVSIGLGFLTGGISIAAENAKSLATKSQPCKAALHPWSDIYSLNK